jgi:two-component system NtrC family sensor kinase
MVLVLVLESFVVMLLVGGIVLLQFRSSHHEKVKAHLAELVEKHKRSIDTFLRTKLGEVRALARTFDYEQLRQPDFLQTQLATLQEESDPAMVDLGVIDARGQQVAYAGEFRLGDADYSEAQWFQEVVKNRRFFISDVFRGKRGLPHFIVAVRNEVRGEPWILRATIDFAAFNRLVENVRVGRTGFAFILNREGALQTLLPSGTFTLDSGPYQELLGHDWPEEGPPQLVEAEDRSGTENLYVSATLKDGDWILIYQQAASDAFSDLRSAFQLTLVIVLFGMIVIVGSAAILVRFVSTRVQAAERAQLAMDAQIVETGKLASVGELAAGIAHEINNPVAIMVEEAGWVMDLLEEEDFAEGENLAEFHRALKQIQSQGGRCKEITHKLLSFARRTDTRVQDVDVYSLVEEMISLSAQRAKYANVEITASLPPGLPSLRTSQSELQQIFLNLINNALDAMEKDGGTIEIKVLREGEDIVIFVTDTGPGIPPAILDRVFDPFFTTKPVGKGTGLGLSIVYGIVKKLGGDIEATSTVDKGTTFRVSFPILQEPAKPDGEEVGITEAP